MSYSGCSDVNCKLRLKPLPPSAQYTNSGCRCLRDIRPSLRMAISRKLAMQRGEIELLQGIVDKCHQGGDMVPLFPGGISWVRGPKEVFIRDLHPSGLVSVFDEESEQTEKLFAYDLFSTREAAQAAGGET